MTTPADLNDLITHKATWRTALVTVRDLAAQHSKALAEDDADVSYWQHELDVFDRTFALIGPPAPAALIPPGKLQITDNHDGLALNLFIGNERVGYVERSGEMFIFNRRTGFAEYKGTCAREEIPTAYERWKS